MPDYEGCKTQNDAAIGWVIWGIVILGVMAGIGLSVNSPPTNRAPLPDVTLPAASSAGEVEGE